MTQRLPRSLRIQEGRQIRQILTTGRKHIGNHLLLYCLASTDAQSLTRAGFLSPKRIGKAVKRNRVRRWMREAFRQHWSEFTGSYQILLMGRPSSINATAVALHDDFLRLCRKAGLLPQRDS